MSEKAKTASVKVELRIKSLDKDRDSVRLIEMVKEHKSELLARLSSEFPQAQITDLEIQSQPAFPGVAEIAAAIVIGIATGVGESIGKKYGDVVIAWIEEFHDVDIIQLNVNEKKDDSASPSA